MRLNQISMKPTKFGVAINDLDETVWVDKKTLKPFYAKWCDMLDRCYGKRKHKGYTVTEEWKYLSKFKEWYFSFNIDHSNYELDKDILFNGIVTYSPQTCAFIPKWLNQFMSSEGSIIKRGSLPLGVYYKQKSKGMINERSKPYCSEIWAYNKKKAIGSYTTAEEAHKQWVKAKAELLQEYIMRYSKEDWIDIRVQERLLAFYEILMACYEGGKMFTYQLLTVNGTSTEAIEQTKEAVKGAVNA